MTTQQDYMIKLDDMNKWYGEFHVLKNINLKVKKGEKIVICGPSGSGKSTTIAALVDYINSNYQRHILTIEDPIEFVHTSKSCLINQREVHRDTLSFQNALRSEEHTSELQSQR